jgi:excisionase family DNA binding protein
MLRITDVARRLDVSESTLRRLVLCGELPAAQLNGKHTSLRVDEDLLEAWLQQRFVGNGDAA